MLFGLKLLKIAHTHSQSQLVVDNLFLDEGDAIEKKTNGVSLSIVNGKMQG